MRRLLRCSRLSWGPRHARRTQAASSVTYLKNRGPTSQNPNPALLHSSSFHTSRSIRLLHSPPIDLVVVDHVCKWSSGVSVLPLLPFPVWCYLWIVSFSVLGFCTPGCQSYHASEYSRNVTTPLFIIWCSVSLRTYFSMIYVRVCSLVKIFFLHTVETPSLLSVDKIWRFSISLVPSWL